MLYILVVDDEADIREIVEMGLSAAYPLDVALASSGKHALEIIEQRGKPEIIISDYRMPNGDGSFLFESLKKLKLDIPFVVCSANPLDELQSVFPHVNGYVQKPKILKAILNQVDSVVARYEEAPEYVPVRIPLLLRLGQIDFDLFMRLSKKKYIKVINSGDIFLESDAKRFLNKKLTHLYISAADAEIYLKSFEKDLTLIMSTEEFSEEEQLEVSFDSIEAIERLASVMGWTPEVIETAKKSVRMAIKSITKEQTIIKLLKKKFSNHSSEYSKHVTMLSMLSCLFSHHLGWVSEATQMKLAMAALLHDVTLDEEYYSDINRWNQRAVNLADKSPETIKYRNHPIESANLVLTMKNLPPDVDQIIVQHHELKDGSGFPRGISYTRISPLTALFIITEDFVNFLENIEPLEEAIHSYISSREDVYTSGSFKKIFNGIRDSLTLGS